LPFIIRELKKAGISDDNIKILIGLGTHRPMTELEMEKKLGSEIVKNYKVINHDWRDPMKLQYVGKTESGTEIWINREVLEADLVLGIGHIVPHRVAGFSGGGKIIQPAVCGGTTTGQTHWLSALYPGEEIMGKEENPVRKEIEAVAEKAGLSAIFNVVQDRSGRIIAAVFGNPIKAHRKGCQISKEVFGVKIPELADVVITDSYPADVDMWQASKGVYSSNLALKKGGMVILVTPCPEGVAPQHPLVEELGYRPLAEVKTLIEEGKIKDLMVAAHLVHVGEVIKQKGRGILVSSGIGPEKAEKIGFLWAPDPNKALEMAFEMLGKQARIAVFRHGGEILPIFSEGV